MQGQSEGLPQFNPIIENAFEYRYLTDEIVPLKHPVGEDIDGLLLGAHNSGGSLVPYFCDTYAKNSGKKVLAIHVAKGATTISEWQKGGKRFDLVVDKIKKGIEKAQKTEKIEKIFYVFLQGESDSIFKTEKEEYIRLLTKFKNDIKSEINIDKFCLIRVGRFVSIVEYDYGHTKDEKLFYDKNVISAQDEAVKRDSDFVILTDILEEMSLDNSNINPQAEGHFNNSALEKIGRISANALTKSIDK